jgi:hypothetical protein
MVCYAVGKIALRVVTAGRYPGTVVSHRQEMLIAALGLVLVVIVTAVLGCERPGLPWPGQTPVAATQENRPMPLIEQARMRYTREDDTRDAIGFLSIGIPVGFAPTDEGVVVLFHRGDYRRLRPQQEGAETGRLAPPFDGTRRWNPISVQMGDQGGFDVLYYESSDEARARAVASYAPDGRLTSAVEFQWWGWDPAFRAFLRTAKGTFVFPHDRVFTPERGWSSTQESPLLDLYDASGLLLRSFGTAQPHADGNIESMLNRGYLAATPRDEFLFAFEHPYRLLKFRAAGEVLWDRTFEPLSPENHPGYRVWSSEEVAKVEEEAGVPEAQRGRKGGVVVSFTGSGLVNGLAIGPRWIAVLAPSPKADFKELSVTEGSLSMFGPSHQSAYGMRIDRLTLDGTLIDSHPLERPANFIRVDADGNIWVLHEGEGVVAKYRIDEP